MALRRCISFYELLFFNNFAYSQPDMFGEIMALCISAIMVLGLILIGPIFKSLRCSNDNLAQQHELILNLAGEGILGLDLDGKVTSVNAAALGICGYEMEELLGRGLHQILHHTKLDDSPYPEEECPIHLSLLTGEPKRVSEDVFWTKAGKNFIVEYVTTPIIEHDRVAGTVLIFKDITERKRTEEALRASERFLADVLDSIQDGISVVDQEYNILRVNPTMERWFPHKLPLPGKKCYEVYQEQAQPCEDCPTRRAMETGQTCADELQLAHGPGEKSRWMEVYAFPMLDPATEKINGVIQYFRDIGQRRQAEEALRANERFLTAIFASIQDGISILDLDYNIVRVNAAMDQAYPQSMPMVGKKCYAAYHGRAKPCEICPTRRTLETGQADRAVVIERGASGEILKFIDLFTFPLIDLASGQMQGVVESVRDITQQKQAEEALHRSEANLLQSQKMEAVGRLAGGVAHDFNNILTAIIGYIELLQAKFEPGDPRLNDTEEIQKAAERAASLTRQLLAFSRKQIFAPKVLNLNKLLLNLDKMLRRLLSEEIKLVTIPGENLGEVKADPGQIEQVIINLAVNARDAMPRGGVITLETQNVSLDAAYAQKYAEVQPGDYVMLAVSDTGSGLDEVSRARIFEPFFTTKELGKGTGLGLSTVHGIIKQSGGHINVYSELGQGATFKVYLPRLRRPVQAEAAAPTSCNFDRGTETILLVEDEEMVRQVAWRILELKGYTVLEAASGPEALVVSQQTQAPIHLMLTDVVMPGMSGGETAERLQAQRPELKILFMSGHTENSIVHHGVLDPGVAFIQKPFRSDLLVHQVRQLLDQPLGVNGLVKLQRT